MKKLNYSVLRHADMGDCSLNGLSARIKNGDVLTLTQREGTIDAKGFPDSEETKRNLKNWAAEHPHEADVTFIAIEDECCGSRRVRGIPVRDYLSGAWTQFGGNFLYACDSRGFKHPIKVHDRIEK